MSERGKLRLVNDVGEDVGVQQWQSLTKFVRIQSRDRDGYVEFDFSIGDPNLFLEMILPEEAFKEFCQSNEVVFVTEAEGVAIDEAEKRWKFGDESIDAQSE